MKSRNGCSQLPTIYQLVTYVIILSNIIFTFIHIQILEQSLPDYIIYALLSLISIIYSLKTTFSVPTDIFVIMQENNRGQPFDYEQYHLNQFCDICAAYVKESTKHCKQCNRCCQEFDHHCKWINNCVGGLNYKQFILMIFFTALQLLHSIIISGRLIKHYSSDQINISVFVLYTRNRIVILIVSLIFLLIELCGFIFLLQLIFFHIYLNYKGLSTYDFIVKRRIRQVLPQNIDIIFNQQDSNAELNNAHADQINNQRNQSSHLFTNTDQKKDISINSSNKQSQSNLQQRKLTLGDSDDQKEITVINFFSQRIGVQVDAQYSKQIQTNEAKTPEATQFQ